MTKGFSFGNPRLYTLRKHYRSEIDRVVMAAYKLLPGSEFKKVIMQFKNCIDPIKIEDSGRLPCSQFQKSGKSCFRENKTACLYVAIRNLIQKWWGCEKEHPEGVEPLLIELDQIIEMWKQEKVVGNVRVGFHLSEGME